MVLDSSLLLHLRLNVWAACTKILIRRVPRPHILYNISTVYSLQLYSSSTVYNLYTTPLVGAVAWEHDEKNAGAGELMLWRAAGLQIPFLWNTGIQLYSIVLFHLTPRNS